MRFGRFCVPLAKAHSRTNLAHRLTALCVENRRRSRKRNRRRNRSRNRRKIRWKSGREIEGKTRREIVIKAGVKTAGAEIAGVETVGIEVVLKIVVGIVEEAALARAPGGGTCVSTLPPLLARS